MVDEEDTVKKKKKKGKQKTVFYSYVQMRKNPTYQKKNENYDMYQRSGLGTFC